MSKMSRHDFVVFSTYLFFCLVFFLPLQWIPRGRRHWIFFCFHRHFPVPVCFFSSSNLLTHLFLHYKFPYMLLKHWLFCKFVLVPASFLTFGKVNPGPPQTDIFFWGGGPPPPPPLIFVSAGLRPQTDIFWCPPSPRRCSWHWGKSTVKDIWGGPFLYFTLLKYIDKSSRVESFYFPLRFHLRTSFPSFFFPSHIYEKVSRNSYAQIYVGLLSVFSSLNSLQLNLFLNIA